METAPLPSGTVTFLFTDIEGSTALWERDRVAMGSAVDQHFALLESAIRSHHGVGYKRNGDAVQAAFRSVSDALEASVEAQLALQEEDWGEIDPLRVRMALHTGEATPQGHDYIAPELNLLARILNSGHGGQLLLSESTRALARNVLPLNVSLRDLGSHRLRGIQAAEQIHQLLHPDLPSEFPPLRTLDARYIHLPQHATSFIGRDQAVAEVVELFRREEVRLMTLIGPGGVGKSRLALRAASDLLDSFPDGAVFVSLAPLADFTLVPSAVIQALGLTEDGRQPAARQLSDFLVHKSLLLILDSFEHVRDAASIIDVLLTDCEAVKILVTSRHPMRLNWEFEFVVPSMSSSESIMLFEARAQARSRDFVITEELRPTVAELCARLDGLPLAIELVAARSKTLSPVAMLERLSYRLDLLDAGLVNAPDRHQTMRAAIDWSHDLLSPAEQGFFRRLSIFPGDFGLGDAITVGSLSTTGVRGDSGSLAILEELIDSSLLRRSPDGWSPRFSMLEVIRDYAAERLTIAGETQQSRLLHASAIASLAEQGLRDHRGVDALVFYDQLEIERHNIRAAVMAAIEYQQSDLVSRLVRALWRFWMAKGHLVEGPEFAEAALQIRADDDLGRSELLMAAAGFAQEQGNAGRAHDLLQEVLNRTSDERERAEILRNLSLVQQSLGQLEDAELSIAEALSLHRELKSDEGVAYDLITLATFVEDRDEHERSLNLLNEAQQLLQQLSDAGEYPDPLMGIAAISGMARAQHCLGDLITASGAYESSYILAHRHGHKQSEAYAIQGLAQIAFDLGRTEEAVSLGELSVQLWRDLGDKRGLAQALADVQRFKIDTRDSQAIVRYLCQRIDDLSKHGERRRIAIWAESLATLTANEFPQLAVTLLGAAVAIREELAWPWLPEIKPHRKRLGTLLFALSDASAYAAAMNEGFQWTMDGLVAIVRALESS